MVNIEEYTLTRIEQEPNYDGIPNILLWGRDANRQLRIFKTKFIPRFYVNNMTNLPQVDEKYYEITNEIHRNLLGKEVRRVNVKVYLGDKSLSELMEEARKLFGKENCNESHIFLTRVFMIYNNIWSNFVVDNGTIKGCKASFYTFPRIWLFDIEVNNPIGVWAQYSSPIYEIVAFSFYDNYDKKIYGFVYHPNLFMKIEKHKVNVQTKFGNEEFEIETFSYNNEKMMLNAILNMLSQKDPDILAGWFSSGYYDKITHQWISGFDIPYIIGRLNYLGIGASKLSPLRIAFISSQKPYSGCPVVRGRVLIDLLAYYMDIQKSIAELPSWSLNYVANYVCGYKSAERKPFIQELWKDNPISVLKHNISDVIKMVLICKYTKLLEEFDKRRILSGVWWDDLLSRHRLNYLQTLRYRNLDNEILPDIVSKDEYTKVQGAYVEEPRFGLHKWVANYDIARAYPEIIRKFNLSPETIDENGEGRQIKVVLYKGSKKSVKKIEKIIGVKTEPRGLIPRMLDMWVEQRNITKQKLREAEDEKEKETLYMIDRSFKAFINSQWGVLGEKSYPLYNPYVAGAITAIGREILQSCKRKGLENEWILNMLYCDTDGLYFTLDAINETDALNKSKELLDILRNEIARYCKEKYNTEPLDIEFTALFKTIFFRKLPKQERSAKKGYAGKIIWDGDWTEKYEVKGFGAKKATYSQLSKEIQNSLLRMILDEADRPSIIKFVKESIERYKQASIKEIGIPKTISKAFHLYEKIPAVVRGAIWSNENLKFNIRPTKVYYIYVKEVKDYMPTDVITYDDESYSLLPLDKIVIDWEKMITILRRAIEPYLEALGINWNRTFPEYDFRKRKPRIEEDEE